MSQPFGLGLGRSRGLSAAQLLLAAAAAALLLGAASEQALDAGAERLTAAADLLVGITWIAVAVVLWRQPRTRRSAALSAAFAGSWLLGSVDPTFLFLHRGPLAHILLAYPTGRLESRPAQAAVAAAYADGIVAGQVGGPEWTLGFAVGLAAAALLRALTATGVVRRSRFVPLVVGCALGMILAAGAVPRLAGANADVLLTYELTLVLAGLAVAADLRAARWSNGSITGLVVDLGERAVGGVVRDRLARAVSDPTLAVAYVIDDGRPPVDEHGRPVELPAPGDARAVTPVDLAGHPVALLIHDPAVLTDRSLVDGASGALSVAVANARLQTEVRASVADVEASMRRLLDAADAERHRLGSELRAHVDPLLQQAADELRAAGSKPALLARVDAVREQLSLLAGGLDPLLVHERGLGPALAELGRSAGIPVSISVPSERFQAAIETCVWFTCSEAIANALKHSQASRLEVAVRYDDGLLHVVVYDDGIGGADRSRGSGLRRLAQRVLSAGGRLAIESPPGGGTRISAEFDLGAGA